VSFSVAIEKPKPEEGGTMFVELMPLLTGRTVLITVAKVDDKTLRVNVIPRPRLTRTRL
jgi:hypothetical protein